MNKSTIENLYIKKKLSVFEVAKRLECSESKINYWIRKYEIPKRSISEAAYLKQNPNGDPFVVSETGDSLQFLLGLGMGLYWGEGTKASKNSVRLGNTDPELLSYFILFLEKIYRVQRPGLRFGLQIFNDLQEHVLINFWCKKLKINKDQFYKVTLSPSLKKGTYSKHAKYGVLTIYFNNTKLRNILVDGIDKLKKNSSIVP